MRSERFLNDVRAEEPMMLRNLVLVPLLGEGGREEFSVLDEAIETGAAKVVDSQSISAVYLDYTGSLPLYIVDGEEIIGALQNRVVNTAVLVEEQGRVTLPVSCVEEGRWSGSSIFRSSHASAYPSLRALLASSVTDSLSRRGKFDSDQSAVWRIVSSTLKSVNVRSRTMSMHDMYIGLEKELDRYIEELEFPQDTVGFLAWSGDEFLGMDLFGNRILFDKLWRKLLRSYALEALTKGATSFPNRSKIDELLESLKKRTLRKFPAVCAGEEYRCKTTDFVGRALLKGEYLIHMAFFPNPN